MKKALAWILVLAMVVSLAACGLGESEESTKKSGSKNPSASTEKSGKDSTKASGSDSTKSSDKEDTKAATEAEKEALPDNMTVLRVQTKSITFTYYAQQKAEDTTEMPYLYDEYGFVTSVQRIRPAETKKTKEWIQTKSGNTLFYSFSPAKADAITVFLKEDGKIDRIERKGEHDTIISYAEGGAEYGAVYQVVTKGTNRDTITYYDAQYRKVYDRMVMEKNETVSDHIFTDDDYCEFGNLLWVADNARRDSCDIQRDAAGKLISHTHKEANGKVRFTDRFLQEGEEIPMDSQTYIILNKNGEMAEIATAGYNSNGNGNYTISRVLYEEIPVVADDLLIAFLHIAPPDVTKTADTVIKTNHDKSW